MIKGLTLGGAGLLCSLGLAACADASRATVEVPPGVPQATVTTANGEARFAIIDQHTVVAVEADDQKSGVPILELPDRQCGDIDAAGAGRTVALTVACDTNYAADTAPARSVALVTSGSGRWHRHDLAGEAFQPAAISPAGSHVAWPQDDGALRWSPSDGFVEGNAITADALAVSDDGDLRGARVVADDGFALRITEGESVSDVTLPARQGDGDAEYSGVQFKGFDTIVVATPEGIPDLRVARGDGRWTLASAKR